MSARENIRARVCVLKGTNPFRIMLPPSCSQLRQHPHAVPQQCSGVLFLFVSPSKVSQGKWAAEVAMHTLSCPPESLLRAPELFGKRGWAWPSGVRPANSGSADSGSCKHKSYLELDSPDALASQTGISLLELLLWVITGANNSASDLDCLCLNACADLIHVSKNR